ncbi:LOW QUALITY PROTEIN: tryptophanyl-tRNA synthetase [Geosmithia morbida]|uniref:tryptophan--tRNA ligase n=1 Tax=Geosmithia morbida TaxID=1094350 RepID=A0A9P4YPC6_9HYPO|nr:LOW QUALITY PROTEIN: tryptophanyl-tRNA synthetase [Geosmithia morbida]KAF4120255.1 LOW QUALITY PROTEIN: tryptophanyl-tRNA synthetase [Geosmithia morbida]
MGLNSGRSLTRVVFSGIQPTGVPHLGNYAGALRQWVNLQHSEPSSTKLIYSIVDLHAITTPQKPEQLARWKREALASLLAIGIDPDRCTLFYQSTVPAHSELMWILSCTASVGYLSRMTQWKSKLNVSSTSTLEDKSVGGQLKLGLFSYPVLQAADILVHRYYVTTILNDAGLLTLKTRATHVPVGHDQMQHLEFARECVSNFNNAYGKHLVPPETLTPPVHRVMSLNDPKSKMSKSAKSEKSRILITDTPEQIRTKINLAMTDSIPGISYDVAERPGISNLLDVWSIFDTQSRSSLELSKDYSDLSPRLLKSMVSDAIIEGLKGVRERYSSLLNSDQGYLDKVEEHGTRKASESAAETMEIVRDAMGMGSFWARGL